MRVIRFLLSGWLLIGATVVADAQDPTGSDPGATQELRSIISRMLDAVAPGDASVWERYLHDRLIHVDENGQVRGKAELLKEFAPLPQGLVGRIEIDRFDAEVYGDTAVVAYEVQEHLDYHGQVLRSRFRVSDAWLKTSDGWRLMSEQVAAVLKDPPAITLSQKQLCAYNGTYALTETITANVRCSQSGLLVERPGRPQATYLPEALDVFFAPGQPRTRRIFVRDERGRVVAFVDRREGEDIRWVKRP